MTPPDLIPVSAACLRAASPLAQYLIGSSQRASKDKATLYYDPRHAVYQLHRDVLDACRGGEGLPEPTPPSIAVPPARWPRWAKVVGKLREPGEVGVGSTTERLLGETGLAFKALLASLGTSCSCGERRDRWDRLYQY